MSDATVLDKDSNIWWLFLLRGLAGVVLGLMLLTDPGATVVALVTVLGFFWLFGGIMSLVRIFVDRSIPWIWSLLSGLLFLKPLFCVVRPDRF